MNVIAVILLLASFALGVVAFFSLLTAATLHPVKRVSEDLHAAYKVALGFGGVNGATAIGVGYWAFDSPPDPALGFVLLLFMAFVGVVSFPVTLAARRERKKYLPGQRLPR